MTAQGDYGSIGGGVDHTSSGDYVTVGGGDKNSAEDDYATCVGGKINRAKVSTVLRVVCPHSHHRLLDHICSTNDIIICDDPPGWPFKYCTLVGNCVYPSRRPNRHLQRRLQHVLWWPGAVCVRRSLNPPRRFPKPP